LRSFHEVSKNKISFRKGSPLLPDASILPLVPSTADFIAEGIDIIFVNPFKGLVEAMMTHPKVRLDLRDKTESADKCIDAQYLNSMLREYQHLHHLIVPHSLMLFESSALSFSLNPMLESLTINVSASEKLSSKMLDGIAESKSLKQLTIVLHSDMKPDEAQEFLEQLSLHSIHGLSCMRFVSQPGRRHKIVMKSNGAWDSELLPSLLINWLRGQRSRVSPDLLGGLAVGFTIRAINKGVPLGHATNVVSRGRAASSSSVIFDCLHTAFSQYLKNHQSVFHSPETSIWDVRTGP
jgi:hypothetical protein